MVLGLGTGSTVFYALERLSSRVCEGLKISGVPTSYQTALLARESGIPLTTLDEAPVLDLAIDGADQADGHLRLIKGRGAALTREKCVAAAALRFIVVIDEQKKVPLLSGLVPVEVMPFAIRPVLNHLRSLGCIPRLRDGIKKDGPVITDNGNFIVDCEFGKIVTPRRAGRQPRQNTRSYRKRVILWFYSEDNSRCRHEKKVYGINFSGCIPVTSGQGRVG